MKSTGLYPHVRLDTCGVGVVSSAGGLLLTEAVRASGLDMLLSQVLAPWRKPFAFHDPGKIVCDLAVSLALGGDCLADIAKLRAEPGVYGLIASDPTVSRLIDTLAEEAAHALAAINAARAQARARVWALAGEDAPDHEVSADAPLIVDLDATLVTSHSDKEGAEPTFKRGFGFHPLWAFVDHGAAGTGEPLSVLLRPGNAGSNTAVDHITVAKAALAQLPGHQPGVRAGRRILIRADSAGGTHEFLDWIIRQRLSYSVGFTLPSDVADKLNLIPTKAWTPAIDADSQIRDGAWVAEATGLLDLTGWPDGMRVIIRSRAPTPGRTAADHRCRRQPRHRVRNEQPPWSTRPPGATTPSPRPRRRPHPRRQGHRTEKPAAARVEPEPHLLRSHRVGLRAHRLDPTARPHRPCGPAVGTQTTPVSAVLHRRPPGAHRPACPRPTAPRRRLGVR